MDGQGRIDLDFLRVRVMLLLARLGLFYRESKTALVKRHVVVSMPCP